MRLRRSWAVDEGAAPLAAVSHAGIIGVVMVACLVGACRTVVDPTSAIRDAQTAAQVKTALVNDPDLGSTTIEVDVVRGVARLSGVVRSQANVDKAAALARAVQGVVDVQLNLRVSGDAVPATANAPVAPPSPEPGEIGLQNEGDPRLFAVGASLGVSRPHAQALDNRVSVGPLIRIGSGRGLGPALAFNWFQTTLADTSSGEDLRGRIHVRPIMAGISYTLASPRVSVSPSIVGGVAFNRVSLPPTGGLGRLAVDVANSLVLRPGVSVWFDVSRRAALNLTTGFVFTRLRVTFLEDERLVRRDMRGDTAIIQAGLAYKLF